MAISKKASPLAAEKIPTPKPPKNAKAAVSKAIKPPTGKFDSSTLSKFKKAHNLGVNAGFKDQTWLPLSQAFNNVIKLPGLPKGQITLLRGLSDTGKSTALWEAAVESQRQGDLVIFIITELKFTWDRLIKLGFQTDQEVDLPGQQLSESLEGLGVFGHLAGPALVAGHYLNQWLQGSDKPSNALLPPGHRWEWSALRQSWRAVKDAPRAPLQYQRHPIPY